MRATATRESLIGNDDQCALQAWLPSLFSDAHPWKDSQASCLPGERPQGARREPGATPAKYASPPVQKGTLRHPGQRPSHLHRLSVHAARMLSPASRPFNHRATQVRQLATIRDRTRVDVSAGFMVYSRLRWSELRSFSQASRAKQMGLCSA